MSYNPKIYPSEFFWIFEIALRSAGSMEKKENKSKNYYTIDLVHIVKFLWKKAWIILFAGIIVATAGCAIASFAIAPTYSSETLLYVNNNNISLGGITLSDLTASQSLVKTYGVIINNRTTLQDAIDTVNSERKANGVEPLPYTYEDLSDMVETGSKNDTEVMYVKITTKDPYESAELANAIAKVLTNHIEVIDGASIKIVDYAIPNEQKVAPSTTKYTAVGLLLGVLGSVVVLAIIAISDDRIHDEDYILDNYDYPILAKIPDLSGANSKKYGYYYRRTANKEAESVTKE